MRTRTCATCGAPGALAFPDGPRCADSEACLERALVAYRPLAEQEADFIRELRTIVRGHRIDDAHSSGMVPAAGTVRALNGRA